MYYEYIVRKKSNCGKYSGFLWSVSREGSSKMQTRENTVNYLMRKSIHSLVHELQTGDEVTYLHRSNCLHLRIWNAIRSKVRGDNGLCCGQKRVVVPLFFCLVGQLKCVNVCFCWTYQFQDNWMNLAAVREEQYQRNNIIRSLL